MKREEILTVLENAKLHAAFESDVEILDACMSALRKQPQWISVEERLPGAEFLDKEIIVYKMNRFGGQLVYVTRFWGTHSALWNDITHWMPLPEPPKEEV